MEWISVKHMTPKEHEDVLVYYPNDYPKIMLTYLIGVWDDDNLWWANIPDSCAVTHWMPLPKPPNLEI